MSVLIVDQPSAFGVRTVATYPTTDYTLTTNLSLLKPSPGIATDWGGMFNDNSDLIDVEVQALKDKSHDALTLTANAQDYVTLNTATQTLTLAQIDLTTDVTGLLPYTSLSGAPTNVSHFTNDSGYLAGSNNLNDVADAAAARTNLGLHTVANTGSYNDLQNTPNLHAVALSGSYSDLINTPDLTLKADLVGGKIPVSQIPAIALTEYKGVAADETAMLAMTGEPGDWCNRTDTQATYIITSGNGSQASDWTQLQYPADTVNSVNGQTGAVVLTHTDVGALAASTYIPQTGVDFDPVGTDNSVNTSLVTTAHDYLSITGQAITLGAIDLATDVTGQLPLTNITGLHAIASSGAYTDLVGSPTNVSHFTNDASYLTASNNLSEVTNQGTARTNLGLHTVANTGSYTDLVNTPTNVSAFANDNGYLVGANNLSELAATAATARTNLGLHAVAASGDYGDLLNTPALSTAALSGDYNDLINKPVNVSTWTNDSGYLAGSNNLSDVNDAATARTNLGLSTVANTGSYNDLSNQPFIPGLLTDLSITDGTNGQVLSTDGSGNFSFADPKTTFRDLNDTTFSATISANSMPVYNGSSWVDAAPAAAKTALGLHAVATSGSYADLNNKPTAVSSFSNDAGYLTTSNNLSDIGNATTARTNLGLHAVAASGDYADLINVPTDNASFSNGAGYLVGTNDLSDLNDPVQARANLALHTVANSGQYGDLANLPDLTLKADLVAGKIPVNQIPSIALTEYKGAVANQAAMLLLTGEPGDWCNRTDTGMTYIITSGNGSTLGDWTEINYPGDAVTSVNGQLGNVSLSYTDVNALPATTYIPQVGTDFDAPGTDNSTPTTLTGLNYLSISGQQLTASSVDLSSHVTGLLPYASLSGAPTSLSTFTNDPGFLTSANNLNDIANAATARTNLGLHAVAASGAYSDLSGVPYIPQAGVDFDSPGSDNSVDTTLNTTNHDYLSISGQEITLGAIDLTTDVSNQLPAASVSGLANVATSGDYGDLVNVPNLESRHDVQVSNLADGQFLAWDATNNKWVNAGIGYGGQVLLHGNVNAMQYDYTLAGQTDVLIGSPADGQVLMYDSAANQWTNQTVTALDPGFTKTTLANGDVEFDFAPSA